jgi:hypothetical protein
MSTVAEFPKKEDDSTEARAAELARAIQVMLDRLPLAEKETVIRLLSESVRPPEPGSKAGDVLGVIIRLLPRSKRWTVEELKKGIEQHGVKATDKQVFNAVGYLARKGRIQRIGYGKYVVGGIPVVTIDDLGGQPSITEGDLDD